MSKRDYYEVLGVAKTATDGEMKTAFRKLAMTFHPDRNPGDKEAEIKFKEINEAYQCLSDGQKRAAYDRFGHAAFSQGGGGGPVSAMMVSVPASSRWKPVCGMCGIGVPWVSS